MKRTLWLLLAAVLALIALLRLLDSGAGSPPIENGASFTAPEADPSTDLEALDLASPEPSESDPDERRGVEAEPVAEEPVATPEPLDESGPRAEIRARFLLPDGEPAMGAEAILRGWVSNDEAVAKYGAPDDWRDLQATVEPDGRLALRFDAPRAYQFRLSVTLPGYVPELWRWSSIEPDAVIDLGDCPMRQGGTLVGRVVDASGNALIEGWRVTAKVGEISFDTKQTPQISDKVDPVTGRFRLQGVPPGRIRLRANSSLTGWVEGPTVQVREGEVHEADIPYLGANPSDTIVVHPRLEGYAGYLPEGIRVRLSAAGVERAATRDAGYSSRTSFTELEPGEYSLRVDDPRFESWSREGVRTGSVVNAVLKGSAAVQLDVRDGVSGEPIEGFRVRARLDERRMSPNEFELRSIDAEADPTKPSGRIDGLLPESQTLFVDAPGRALLELQVADLQPGEVRHLEARLFGAPALHGRVRTDPPGGTVRGTTVQLGVAGSGPTEAPSAWSEAVGQGFLQAVQVDDDGRFELAGVPPGRYALHAYRSAYAAASREIVVRADAPAEEFELVLPRAATLEVDIERPMGASLDGTLLGLTANGDRVVATDERDQGLPTRTPPASGDLFRLEELPATELLLSLHFPVDVYTPGATFAGSDMLGMILGPVTLLEGETKRVRHDLRERWPGSLVVEVQQAGQPVEGVLVQAVQRDRRGEASCRTGRDGLARFSLAPIGEYEVQALGGGDEWTVSAPGPVLVRSGEESRLTLPLDLAVGRVRLVSSDTGEPLAEVDVSVSVTGTRARKTKRTDAEGFLELELPPGSLTISHPASGGATKSLEWSAHGPLRQELAFP